MLPLTVTVLPWPHHSPLQTKTSSSSLLPLYLPFPSPNSISSSSSSSSSSSMSRRGASFLSRKAIAPSLPSSPSGRSSSVSSLSAVFGSTGIVDDDEEDLRVGGGEKREVEEDWNADDVEEDRWSRLLPELLVEIIRRVEETEERWPTRRNVVACACVCKRWREITVGIVKSVGECGKITFPLSLKQPGTKELPLQCFIKRNRKNSTFYLHLSLTQTFMDNGKFLMAARRYRHGAYTEYIISLDADDLSQGSNAYVGKLSSDFLGTKFTIYDSQPPFNGAKASSNRASRRFTSKQISPQVPARNFIIGHVSYKFNLLRSRGPRRMVCTLQNPPIKEIMDEEARKNLDTSKLLFEDEPIVLKNNAPRWHEHLQCWCLNFHGRVTVASVKNFQLALAGEHSETRTLGDDEGVILQFGKVGDDMFTMDYRHPLSAFQAFAICLTSFGTKLACE